MTYSEVLDKMYQRLPMFTRTGPAAYKPDLVNIQKLLSILGNPHLKLQCIHIAGTNGKGSISHLLASVLQCQGYKTGLATSPHLIDFRERIRINGTMIPENIVVDFYHEYISKIEEIPCSFFEFTMALTFWYFANENTDWVVLETGLGGRLDSTNVVTPVLSIVTNVGMDHQDLLGPTIQHIAHEKSGIIKSKVPVVLGEDHSEYHDIFESTASRLNAPFFNAEQNWEVYWDKQTPSSFTAIRKEKSSQLLFKHQVFKCEIPLQGDYQLKNLATLLTAMDVLVTQGIKIQEENIFNGIKHVMAQTGFAGRWQKVQENPSVILDTGHNAHAMPYLIQQINQQPAAQVWMVWGMMGDKDSDAIQSCLKQLRPCKAIACQPMLPRAKSVEKVAEMLREAGLKKVYEIPNVEDAVKFALAHARKEDFIFVGGSTFVVAEALPLWS